MQRNGLEWLYRVISEPRRLWRRSLVTNSLFVLGASRQLLALQRPAAVPSAPAARPQAVEDVRI